MYAPCSNLEISCALSCKLEFIFFISEYVDARNGADGQKTIVPGKAEVSFEISTSQDRTSSQVLLALWLATTKGLLLMFLENLLEVLFLGCTNYAINFFAIF